MKYGLSQATIHKIRTVLARHSQVEQAVLYGSRAKGDYKNGSDIDLTLEGSGLNLSVINSLLNEVDDLLLPYTFDVSIFKQINNVDLIEHIERVGKVFYEKQLYEND